MPEDHSGAETENATYGTYEQYPSQPARKRTSAWIVFLVLVVIFGALTAFSIVSRNQALEKMDSLAFADAAALFDRIPFGKQIFPMESEYVSAGKLAAEGRYEESAEAFKQLGLYREAPAAVKEARYQQAAAASQAGDFTNASELYAALKDYRDSAEREKEARLNQALALADDGDTENAKVILHSLIAESYEPAKDKLVEVCKTSAARFAENGEYGKAYLELKDLAGTNVIDTLLRTYRSAAYEAAQKAYRGEDIATAEQLFSEIGDDYEEVSAYQTLISIRKKTYATVAEAQQDAQTLVEIIRFEDAGELLLSNQSLAEQFLYGLWENGSSYFALDVDGSIYYSLPAFDFGDYYSFENGKVQLYELAHPNTPKTLFAFTVVSADCVMVTAMQDGSVYTLYRTKNNQ